MRLQNTRWQAMQTCASLRIITASSQFLERFPMACCLYDTRFFNCAGQNTLHRFFLQLSPDTRPLHIGNKRRGWNFRRELLPDPW